MKELWPRNETWFAMALLIAAVICSKAAAELPIGTVFVSRNINEADNTSLGYWNHLSIVVSEMEIVEAQVGQGTIRTKLSDYLARPYSRPILALVPCSVDSGKEAAERAKSFVGQQYSNLGSLLRMKSRRMQRGIKPKINCVVPALKAAYWHERACRWVKIPDHALKVRDVFHPPRPLAELMGPDESPLPLEGTERSVLKK